MWGDCLAQNPRTHVLRRQKFSAIYRYSHSWTIAIPYTLPLKLYLEIPHTTECLLGQNYPSWGLYFKCPYNIPGFLK